MRLTPSKPAGLTTGPSESMLACLTYKLTAYDFFVIGRGMESRQVQL